PAPNRYSLFIHLPHGGNRVYEPSRISDGSLAETFRTEWQLRYPADVGCSLRHSRRHVCPQYRKSKRAPLDNAGHTVYDMLRPVAHLYCDHRSGHSRQGFPWLQLTRYYFVWHVYIGYRRCIAIGTGAEQIYQIRTQILPHLRTADLQNARLEKCSQYCLGKILRLPY